MNLLPNHFVNLLNTLVRIYAGHFFNFVCTLPCIKISHKVMEHDFELLHNSNTRVAKDGSIPNRSNACAISWVLIASPIAAVVLFIRFDNAHWVSAELALKLTWDQLVFNTVLKRQPWVSRDLQNWQVICKCIFNQHPSRNLLQGGDRLSVQLQLEQLHLI